MQLVGYDMTKAAARQVYEAAGIGPDDVDVIELHDCFAQNELITYEALGLCPEGGAEKFVDDGDNTYGGRYVTNPSGGLLSKGHPLGATGLAQCFELTQQLRGTADQRQVEGARIGLQHNLGLGGACVVTLYRATDERHAHDVRCPPRGCTVPFGRPCGHWIASHDRPRLHRAHLSARIRPTSKPGDCACSPRRPARRGPNTSTRTPRARPDTRRFRRRRPSRSASFLDVPGSVRVADASSTSISRRVLHAAQGFRYFAPIHAGDRLTFASRIDNVFHKKGGALTFIVKATDVTNQRGVRVAELRSTIVVRGD